MSYISGFMLGASIGKAVHKYFSLGAGTKRVVPARPVRTAPLRPVRRTGRQVPSLVCVSAVPGRRRYRAFALIGNPEAADILQNGLQQVKGVTSVSVNPVVGSILLRAENDDIFRRVEVFLENRFFFVHVRTRPMFVRRPPAIRADSLRRSINIRCRKLCRR